MHERLHRLIKEIVSLKHAGEAEQAESHYGEIESISAEIVGLLKRLERRLA